MVERRGKLERRRFWRAAIGRQRTSGLSVRAFCRRESLSEPSFYAWRKRLAPHRSAPRRATAFAAVRVAGDPSNLKPDPTKPCRPSADCVEIVLADGVRVRVPPGTDRRAVADILAVLRSGEAVLRSGDAEESPSC